MRQATFIRELEGFTGRANLYRVMPPIKDHLYDWENETERQVDFDYIVVSATYALGDPETYIFGADANGNILSWRELPGSFKGAIDHNQALAQAGYALAEPEPVED